MKMRIKSNERVRHYCSAAIPRTGLETKTMSLAVKCAADFPIRIPKLENLFLEICTKKLAPRMQPTDLVAGRFEVDRGFEVVFREIAAEHGFNASEVYECP